MEVGIDPVEVPRAGAQTCELRHHIPDEGHRNEVEQKAKDLRTGLNLSRISLDGVLQRRLAVASARRQSGAPRIHVRQQGDDELEMSHRRLDLSIYRGGGRQPVEHGLQLVADAGFGQLKVAQ